MGDAAIQIMREYGEQLQDSKFSIIHMHELNKVVASQIARICGIIDDFDMFSEQRQQVMGEAISHARALIMADARIREWGITVNSYDSSRGDDIMMAYHDAMNSTQDDVGDMNMENHWMVVEVRSILRG